MAIFFPMQEGPRDQSCATDHVFFYGFSHEVLQGSMPSLLVGVPRKLGIVRRFQAPSLSSLRDNVSFLCQSRDQCV